jgi:hypothetical protein
MTILGLIILAALLIPIAVVLVDSPIGKALARRLEGPYRTPPEVSAMAQRIEALESEVDQLSQSVDRLQEANQFLQKLLEDPRQRPTLPPSPEP